MSYYIGVVGELFNITNSQQVQTYLNSYLNQVINLKNRYEDKDSDDSIYIVTGLIDKGITNIIMKIARARNWKVVGVDSIQSKDSYDQPKTDYEFYIDGKFGDENEFFVRNIDAFIRIGGIERDRQKETLALNYKWEILVYSKDI